MPSRSTGIVTFLFTDIEASTRLIQDIGDQYAGVLGDYRRLLDEAVRTWGGEEVGTQGDGCLAAFFTAEDGVAAAAAAQQALVRHRWPEGVSLRVRMGLHTGEAIHEAGDYIGLSVHRAARICAAAHGGQILLSEAVQALAARHLPPGIGLRDVGSHRLKDLREPEHLYQVLQRGLPVEFPPIESLGPNNLPLQLTSFVGREHEMEQVKGLLAKTRLLTLSGSGGLGKTRLAIQVAADLTERFPHGVWFVELAPLTDAGLIPQAMASLFGLREEPGRPLLATLTEYLRRRHLLLILDNSEHLVEGCAPLVDGLLRACPHLHVLSTSRQTLGIAGETTWLIPPLSSPGADDPSTVDGLGRYEAVRLFSERAAAIVPHFTLTAENAPIVAEVCRRMDGIPLAIELAAARLRILSIEQIRQRLDQRFQLLTAGSRTALPRHQTLRAAIDWSYALLAEKERVLFGRLAAFVGGCAPEAAEAICAGGAVESGDVLGLVAQLVDKSLLLPERRADEVRYRMLDTILEFGRDKLREAGEESAVRARHAAFFLSLAERAEPQLRGTGQAAWFARLETEHDNLRVALDWLLQRDGEAVLRLGCALWWFWYVHGYYREGREWLSQALHKAGALHPLLRARALTGAGYLATSQGDYAAARPLLEESLRTSRDSRDDSNTGFVLNSLGRLAWYEGEFDRAFEFYIESLSVFRRLDDKYSIGVLLNNLGVLAISRGELEQARSWLEESLVLGRALKVNQRVAFAASNLSVVALRRSEYDLARALLRESLSLDSEVGDKRSISSELEGFGVLAASLGQPARAARLLGAAEALRESIGSPLTTSSRALVDYDRYVEMARADLTPDAFAASWREGRSMSLKEAIEYARGDAEPGDVAQRRN